MSLSSRPSCALPFHTKLASKSRHFLLRVCLVGLMSMGLVPISKGQSTVPPAPVRQVIFSPFAGIQDFDKWEIEIANRSDEDVPATVTAYSSDGESFSPVSLQLGRNQINRLDIRAFLLAGSRPQSGGTIGGITVDA